MRTLLARGLIEEAGHDPESGAVLFATTTYFLERMGLRSLHDLPARTAVARGGGAGGRAGSAGAGRGGLGPH